MPVEYSLDPITLPGVLSGIGGLKLSLITATATAAGLGCWDSDVLLAVADGKNFLRVLKVPHSRVKVLSCVDLPQNQTETVNIGCLVIYLYIFI